MAPRRGDVVLIPFPYTNLSASKTRPAVSYASAGKSGVDPDRLRELLSG